MKKRLQRGKGQSRVTSWMAIVVVGVGWGLRVVLTRVMEVSFPRKQTLEFCDLPAGNLLGSELRNNTCGGVRKARLGSGEVKLQLSYNRALSPSQGKL